MDNAKPEVIVKQRYETISSGEVPYAVPEILLLGNRQGLRELGERLIRYAQRERPPEYEDWDPDDHEHLGTKLPPFNPDLSDELEFRVGILNEANRTRVLEKYSIGEATRLSGHLADMYRKQAEAADEAVRRIGRY